ncbi:hypothetical protein [Paraeggerthella sp.]|uniref:hypothetical protein n=1 Tax=Paraeggerthella sp. TaxID=2897350 RepID=UPI003AB8AB1D
MQEPKRIPVSDDEDAVVYSKPMQQKMAAMNRAERRALAKENGSFKRNRKKGGVK